MKMPTIRAACSANSPAHARGCEAPGAAGSLDPPGGRSPRRGEGKSTKAKTGGAGSTKAPPARAKAAKPAPSAQPKPPPPTPRADRDQAPPPPDAKAAESGRGSVEEVAWAGITVAAEAATLGVRLLSRAVEAVRERR